MKKNNLYFGIAYVVIGILFILLTVIVNQKLQSIFTGLGFGLTFPGVILLWKYFYWNKPENIERYKEKMENEQIDLHDERKVSLRDKSGRYAYILGVIILAIAVLVFSVINSCDIKIASEVFIIFLDLFFAFQIIIGIVIFRYLNNKY